ncbi:MAG: GCN5-related N-acetyltransferase [Symbiobacteriaceae bacterium]|jgi:GNAT superfamily N-acetyltransferase|nr:GCN5-related N-acetyltransferase [Symbiobacteriaceae bacterium]
MTLAITVRKATPADKDAVVALCRAIEPRDYVPEMFDEAAAAPPPQGLYVAELDGRVVGCHLVDVTAPGTGFFFGMRIDPRVQGQGIGSAYAGLQVAEAVAGGLRRLFLTSAPGNVRAHRTVEKNGFVNRGEWVIWEMGEPGAVGAAEPSGAGAQPLRVRAGTPADLPAVAAFQGAMAGQVLSEVIAAPDFPYGFSIIGDEDWAVEDLVVAEEVASADLAGLMLLRQIEIDGQRQTYVRRLEGSLEAAAALLDYARSWAGARGLEKWCVSLPARCEPLLAPLGLDPAKCERWYMFEYEAK